MDNQKNRLLSLLTQAQEGKVLFLGKEGSFTRAETLTYVQKYGLTLVEQYEEGVVAVVEHHQLNPVEEDISCMAYDAGISLFKLDTFEMLLSQELNGDALLMGIQLNNNQQRIYRMLGNQHLDNGLFVKLLSRYSWHEEEDNREDRDVIMFTLRRYITIRPNEEDLLYTPLTLKRLALEAEDARLLEVLVSFPAMTFLQKGKQKMTLTEAIALNSAIDHGVIQKLLRLNDSTVERNLASNSCIPQDQLQAFAQKESALLNQALAANSAIDKTLLNHLLTKDSEVVALLLHYQPMSVQRYEMACERLKESKLLVHLGSNMHLDRELVPLLIKTNKEDLLVALAQNHTLSSSMLESIFSKKREETYTALAQNPATPVWILNILYETYQEHITMLTALAYNSATPVEVLRLLYEKEEFEIMEGIASNKATPLEILNILKIDTRLRNALTSNETFVASITQKLGL